MSGDYVSLLIEGVGYILKSWSLLRGVVETNWKVGDKRNLKELKEFIDETKYKFEDCKNNLEIERLFINELVFQMKSNINRLRYEER